jgi:hypothetical protein
MGRDSSDQPIDIEILNQEGEAALTTVFHNYRSLIDPNLMIFVAKDAVPPFRFKAGGWELLQSSIELGPAMKARVAEKGFFMCRVNEDQAGWIELTDLPQFRRQRSRVPGGGVAR